MKLFYFIQIRKMFEIELKETQKIALLLLDILKDPELIIYFIKLYKNYCFEEARYFHLSLRKNPSLIETYYKKKIKSYWETHNIQFPEGVPISFNIPFTPLEWRNILLIKEDISYFYPEFLTQQLFNVNLNDFSYYELDITKKIILVNVIRKRSDIYNQRFIKESLEDHILYYNDYEYHNPQGGIYYDIDGKITIM